MSLKKIELPLGEGVTAFSTLRNSAATMEPYSGFNVCAYTGGDPHTIAANMCALSGELHVGVESMIMPRQTHSANVARISRINGRPAFFNESGARIESLEGVDALVTDEKSLVLCINTADCVPVVLADAETGIVGVAHSGWRGTAGRIAAHTVRTMAALGAIPGRIRVALGPHICRDCFEVGEDVADIFRREFSDPEIVTVGRGGKPHVDLSKAIAETLAGSGVDIDNIQCPDECSCHNPDRYFSARRLGVASGRTLTVVTMR